MSIDGASTAYTPNLDASLDDISTGKEAKGFFKWPWDIVKDPVPDVIKDVIPDFLKPFLDPFGTVADLITGGGDDLPEGVQTSLPLAVGYQALKDRNFQGVIDYVDQQLATGGHNKTDTDLMKIFKAAAETGKNAENAASVGDGDSLRTNLDKLIELFTVLSDKVKLDGAADMVNHYTDIRAQVDGF
ncbi:MAG: hypothetical protein V3U76_04925 [Granulosicoccus sp.]